VEKRYLLHFLQYIAPQIEKAGEGATVKGVTLDWLRSINVPLPPLGEQRRIAAALDHAEVLCLKRQSSVEKYEILIRSLFDTMFMARQTEQTSRRAPLGELCDLVRGSSPRPQGDPRYFGGPVPRLMIADITRDGAFVTPAIDSLTIDGATKSRPMKAGSVVMAVSGAVGLPAILQVDACIHDGFVGFRDLDRRITPLFLYFWLLQERASHSSRSTGAIWTNLTTDQVKAFEIPILALRVQERFAHCAEIINHQAQLARLHFAKINDLFQVLQRKAFGENGTRTHILSDAAE
jgi:restriction endonuclease S subunit